jgi:formylglycine-generating enzyme required for sulfatase activity
MQTRLIKIIVVETLLLVCNFALAERKTVADQPVQSSSDTKTKNAVLQKDSGAKEAPKKGENAWVDEVIGLEMVGIGPGCFQMGTDSANSAESDEKSHKVCITKGFWMGKHEITQGQWKLLLGETPAHFKNCGEECPVEQVSWDDVQKFIKELNLATGLNYHLPTEAEWEYAARAGKQTESYAKKSPNNSPGLDSISWYAGNSGVQYAEAFPCADWVDKQYPAAQCGTHPVGKKQPNVWGLYDMLGNVWEMTADWYDYDYYRAAPANDPPGPERGANRATRGCSWNNDVDYCRLALRSYLSPERGNYSVGFRLVRDR